jgi:hypothetical protein
MKKSVITSPIKFIVKRRKLLMNSLIFATILSIVAASCIKEDYPVRLVYPVLTTLDTSGVTATTVISGGNITSDGGTDIIARGICLSKQINPNIAVDTLGHPVDTITVDGTGIGEFESTISILAANTTYHIRAYATNPNGTAYGQDIAFKTKAVTK